MSLNYYIHTRDINMVFDLMPRVEINKDEREFIIHLCQTTGGFLKPLFECHSYSTFKELREIILNSKYYFSIKDEYYRDITPDEFIESMVFENMIGESRVEYGLKLKVDDEGYEFMDQDFC